MNRPPVPPVLRVIVLLESLLATVMAGGALHPARRKVGPPAWRPIPPSLPDPIADLSRPHQIQIPRAPATSPPPPTRHVGQNPVHAGPSRDCSPPPPPTTQATRPVGGASRW